MFVLEAALSAASKTAAQQRQSKQKALYQLVEGFCNIRLIY
jgi:hypothetical protein